MNVDKRMRKMEKEMRERQFKINKIRHEIEKRAIYKIGEEKQKSYFFILNSKSLPFALESFNKHEFDKIEKANSELQKFVRHIEKKFDAVWYIGSDILGEEIYERFMFHHGGFMEISLRGKIRAFFAENKIEKFRKAVYYATLKTSNKTNAQRVFHEIKSGQKLISLKGSLEDVGG